MAKSRNSSPLLSHLLLLLLFFFFFFSTTHQHQQQQEINRGGGGGGGLVLGRRTGGEGRLVGGRTKVEDVNTNKEVQELGKYCVEQYNKNRDKSSSNGSSISRPAVVFVKVVEAEKQVVSGIKYYLKISAAVSTGGDSSGIVKIKTFNAVVVVKPWADSKDMLSFCPSSPSVSTK